MASTPRTLVHGDYRADNMFFDDDGRVVLFDFQVIGESTPAGDLAYFVTGSLAPATASEIEQDLYQRWLGALASEGRARVGHRRAVGPIPRRGAVLRVLPDDRGRGDGPHRRAPARACWPPPSSASSAPPTS